MSARDEFLKAMKKTGRVTLNVEVDDSKIIAKGEGGVRFRLDGQPGQEGFSREQILGSPQFYDENGVLWRGRYYEASKSAHFQRTTVKRGAAKGTKAATRKTAAKSSAKAKANNSKRSLAQRPRAKAAAS